MSSYSLKRIEAVQEAWYPALGTIGWASTVPHNPQHLYEQDKPLLLIKTSDKTWIQAASSERHQKVI